MKLRNLIIFLLIILVATPLTWYSIKKYRAGADIHQNLSDQSQISDRDDSPGMLVKRGIVKTIAEAKGNPSYKMIEPKEERPLSIIVKLKKGEDVAEIIKSSEKKSSFLNNRVEIQSLKPLISKTVLDKSLSKMISRSPQKTAEITDRFNQANIENIYLLQLKYNNQVDAQLQALKQNPAVEYAELDRPVRIQSIPNDPYYSSTNSWGQGYDDLWGLKKINIETAWDKSQGEDVIVAVIDTGVDYNHEDLSANIWENSDEIPGNNLDDDNNGRTDDIHGWDFIGSEYYDLAEDNDPMDGYGHGTHVAGTIAAVMNNNLGIVGVAPKSIIMPIKGLDDDGSGLISTLHNSIFYAVVNGAEIINASWSGEGRSEDIESAISFAHSNNVTFVSAAGNESSDTVNFFPANAKDSITVSALTHASSNDFAQFSNHGNEVDISAPGGDNIDWQDDGYKYVNILSLHAANTDPYGGGTMIVGDQYYRMSGTSMATPHIAGAAALIKKINRNFSPNTLERIMETSADDRGSSGWDKYYGWGKLNAINAIELAERVSSDQTAPTKPKNFTAQAIHTRQVDLNWRKATDDNLIVEYDIYRDGILLADVYGTSFTDSTVNQGNTYQYTIKAFDGINYSHAVSVTVATPTDTEPPTVPDNFQAEAFATKVDLSWSASTDNYYLKGYTIYRDDQLLANIDRDQTSYTDYSINENEIHRYWLNAYDLENNYSPVSTSVEVVIPKRSFVDSGVILPHLTYVDDIKWGDYDNDGDQDFIIGGKELDSMTHQNKPLSRIYRNDGGNFTPIFIILDANNNEMGQSGFDWGDYDNDGDLDLAVSDQSTEVDEPNFPITVYKNDGNDQFSLDKQLVDFRGIVKWSDLDNDGDLDLVASGYDLSQHRARVVFYQNDNGIFIDTGPNNIMKSNVYMNKLNLIDYDNDGDLDLQNNSFIYRNNGNFVFEKVIRFPIQSNDTANGAWGDYDNDGDLDLALSDWRMQGNEHLIIYKNTYGKFKKQSDLYHYGTTIAWGDYDNDGDLDILTTGKRLEPLGSGWFQILPASKIFRNDGNNQFKDIGPELTEVRLGSIAWADYDNDNDLDFILVGDDPDIEYGTYTGQIFENLTADADHFNKPNQKPNPPINFNKKIIGNNVTLSWNSGATGRSDPETPEPGLYFNLRLGTTPGGQEIVSKTNSTPLLGNYLRPKFTAWLSPRLYGRKITNLASGRYYWSVQTIDTGLKTSDWSSEQIFDIP